MDLMAAFSDKKHNELHCLNTFNLSSRLDSNVQYPSNVGDFAVFQSDLSKTPAFTAVEWKDANVNKISATLREQIVQVLLGNITADAAVRAVQDKADRCNSPGRHAHRADVCLTKNISHCICIWIVV